jgi:hypothetical protein
MAYGGLGRNRTADTRIFSPLLYRLSYQADSWLRGQDSNLRPSGYEPDELPTAPPRDVSMDFAWCGREDLNLHEFALTRT